MSIVGIQRAEHAYAEFISNLSPIVARNVALGEPDVLNLPGIEVSREEMLVRFLAVNKQFEQFRARLAEFRKDLEPRFFVNKDLWELVRAR